MDMEVLLWHVCNRYLGRKHSVIVIHLYRCVEKWQNDMKNENLLHEISLTSMKKNHSQ